MKRNVDRLIGIPLLRVLAPFAPKSVSSNESPKKLLVIKLAAVGDTVLLIPILRALRSALPSTEIHFLCSGVNLKIAETIPYVDRVLTLPKLSPMALLQLAALLKREHYDVAVDFEQWARATPLLMFLAKIPRRIGFDTPGQFRAGLFTQKVEKKSERHEVEEFFQLASAVTTLSLSKRLELFETEAGEFEAKKARELIKGKGPIVILHPGCGADGLPREWPLERYAVLGHFLMKKFSAHLVITGGPDEIEKTNKLAKLLNGHALNLGGKLTWLGTISFVKQADAVISGNTGIMHIAAAMNRPQVALHGPTDPRLWGPLNDKAVVVQSSCPGCPCLKLGFEYHRRDQSCMSFIEVEEVKAAVARLFDNKNGI